MNYNKYFFFFIISGLLHFALIAVSVVLNGPQISLLSAPSSFSVTLAVKRQSFQRVKKNKAPSEPFLETTPTTAVTSELKNSMIKLPILYPELSRQRGEEGVVDLRVAINQAGSIAEVIILKSSGHKRLDAEATRAAQQLQGMAPGQRDFSVRFKLDD